MQGVPPTSASGTAGAEHCLLLRSHLESPRLSDLSLSLSLPTEHSELCAYMSFSPICTAHSLYGSFPRDLLSAIRPFPLVFFTLALSLSPCVSVTEIHTIQQS